MLYAVTVPGTSQSMSTSAESDEQQQHRAVLVIEDDLSLQDSLRTFFADHGFATHAAATRRDGEALLRRHRRGVCLLDLNLPDGSGLDLLHQVVRERLDVRVVVMTALPIHNLRQRFPESVLAAVMTKPVSPQDLLAVVGKIGRTATR